MKTSFVYILLCADNTYYTGVTENVYKRFDEHQEGKFLVLTLILVVLFNWFIFVCLQILNKQLYLKRK